MPGGLWNKRVRSFLNGRQCPGRQKACWQSQRAEVAPYLLSEGVTYHLWEMPTNSLASNVRNEPELQKCIKDTKHIGGHSKTLTFTKRKKKERKGRKASFTVKATVKENGYRNLLWKISHFEKRVLSQISQNIMSLELIVTSFLPWPRPWLWFRLWKFCLKSNAEDVKGHNSTESTLRRKALNKSCGPTWGRKS